MHALSLSLSLHRSCLQRRNRLQWGRKEMSILSGFLYPPPSSAFMTAMTAISTGALAYFGLSEAWGKHLQYSKFWNAGSPPSGKQIRVSSRVGMLLLYTPALVAAAAAFAVPAVVADDRCRLLALALALHFFKRDLEVLFIHQYSGNMILNSAIPITLSYFTGTVCMIYAQYVTQGVPGPTLDLKVAGEVLFLVGITGNFYHHHLLSKLREKGDKTYKIPKGGLFELVICPHYLFEVIVFIGFCLISQTLYSFFFALGTIWYLMGRSYATRRWYLSKFENFPRQVKALIPYVF